MRVHGHLNEDVRFTPTPRPSGLQWLIVLFAGAFQSSSTDRATREYVT
jgi:hypothetical protein